MTPTSGEGWLQTVALDARAGCYPTKAELATAKLVSDNRNPRADQLESATLKERVIPRVANDFSGQTLASQAQAVNTCRTFDVD